MRKNKTKNGERVQVKESEKSERTSDLSSYPIVKRRREVKAIRKAKDFQKFAGGCNKWTE